MIFLLIFLLFISRFLFRFCFELEKILYLTPLFGFYIIGKKRKEKGGKKNFFHLYM